MSNTTFKTLSLNQTNGILIVTLNRPHVLNAINVEMMAELLDLWQTIHLAKEKVRCIILTGQGDKAFSAGADLKERHGLNLREWRAQRLQLELAMYAMLDCPVPIIAAVNGIAYGGGLELAMACDFIYASTTATFAQPEVKLGLMPGAMGTQNLPRAAGIRRAKELSYSGEVFTAEQSYHWGITNKLCAPEQLMHETLSIAQKICANAPLAVQQVKKSLNMSLGVDLRSGYQFEIEAYQRLLTTQDKEEGINAFNEKRKPVFNGE